MLNQLTQEAPDFLPASLLVAVLDEQDQKYKESDAAIARVLSLDPANPDALLLNGKLKLDEGDPAKAVIELEAAHSIVPASAQTDYQLAQAYFAVGSNEKAIGILNQAAAIAPNYAPVVLSLAQVEMQKGEIGTAIILLKQFLQQRTDVLEGQFLLATCFLKQNDYDDALGLYRQVAAVFPKNAQATTLVGVVLSRQGKRAEARSNFEKALQLTPGYFNAVQQLVNLDLGERQYAAARKRLENEIALKYSVPESYLLLANVFIAQKDAGQAEAALRESIRLAPNSSAPYLLLAKLYISNHQDKSALADLKEALTTNPKDTETLMLMGTIQQQERDYAAASSSYEKLLEISPRYNPALNNLAYLYAENFGRLDKAYDLAKAARIILPTDPYTADTLGWILYHRRQYEWALSLLNESADKLPDVAEAQFHLGMTDYMMGHVETARAILRRAVELSPDFPGRDEAEQRLTILAIDAATTGPSAQATLEKAVAEHPDDAEAQARLAVVYERLGAIPKAVAAGEAALRANPYNASNLLVLARLYATQNDRPKALAAATKAHNLAPNDIEVSHALGRLAYQAGDFAWSVSLLESCLDKSPDDPSILFDLALAVYSVGRVNDAASDMRQALQKSTTLSSANDARLFLEMLAFSADPSAAVAKKSLVANRLKAAPNDLAALVAMANISEHENAMVEATQIYTKVLDLNPSFAPAQKQLVILYAHAPEIPRAAFDLAVKARATFPDDFDVSQAFGIIAYRTGDFPDAASVLKATFAKQTPTAEGLFYLGMSQFHLNQSIPAKRSLLGALKLGLASNLAREAKLTLSDPRFAGIND